MTSTLSVITDSVRCIVRENEYDSYYYDERSSFCRVLIQEVRRLVSCFFDYVVKAGQRSSSSSPLDGAVAISGGLLIRFDKRHCMRKSRFLLNTLITVSLVDVASTFTVFIV
jgi:hypothetical protein